MVSSSCFSSFFSSVSPSFNTLSVAAASFRTGALECLVMSGWRKSYSAMHTSHMLSGINQAHGWTSQTQQRNVPKCLLRSTTAAAYSMSKRDKATETPSGVARKHMLRTYGTRWPRSRGRRGRTHAPAPPQTLACQACARRSPGTTQGQTRRPQRAVAAHWQPGTTRGERGPARQRARWPSVPEG